tara:strand:- start:1572 stop:2000 length:429 start_codon:yes stop_codon:yes gene_type:complete
MSYAKLGQTLTTALMGAGAVGVVAKSFFYVVQPGERAIIFDRFQGVKQNVYNEGMHVKVPFLQWPVIYNTRITPSLHRTETASKDLQTVRLTVRLLYQPVIEKLPWIYSEVGENYAERVLPSIGNEVLKGKFFRIKFSLTML